MISKSFDENLSESKDLNDVNFALSSNFDDSENWKKLDDISDINTSPMLQTKIVKSLSMLKSGIYLYKNNNDISEYELMHSVKFLLYW